MIAVLVLWPLIGGYVGAIAGMATFNMLFAFLLRSPRWRRFDRSMTRFMRGRPWT